MKVSTNGLCHNKMAVMPIYGKNLFYFFSGTKRPMALKLGMEHWLLEHYQVCSNDDPVLTLTYFTTRSNLVVSVYFRETIEACEVKVDTYSQINEYVAIYDNRRSKSITDLCPRSLRFNTFKLLFHKKILSRLKPNFV